MSTDSIAARYGSGQSVRRIEDPALVQGLGRYTDDVAPPGVTVRALPAVGEVQKPR